MRWDPAGSGDLLRKTVATHGLVNGGDPLRSSGGDERSEVFSRSVSAAGRRRTFSPEAGSLVDAEAVLLVDDGEAEVAEDDVVFQQRVRADEDAQAAVLQRGVDGAPLLLRRAAGQQRALHGSGLEILLDIGVVLLREHLGGRHDAGLEAVADGHQAAQHRHHRLAGTYVALQQAVHLVPARQVAADLLDHPLLRPGQGVGEGVVARVEVRSDLGHQQAALPTRTDIFLLQQRELQEEESAANSCPSGNGCS